MAAVRLFASIREIAGTADAQVEADTVAAALSDLAERFGDEFALHLETCRVWVNGEPAGPTDPLGADDELAILPPVSGG